MSTGRWMLGGYDRFRGVRAVEWPSAGDNVVHFCRVLFESVSIIRQLLGGLYLLVIYTQYNEEGHLKQPAKRDSLRIVWPLWLLWQACFSTDFEPYTIGIISVRSSFNYIGLKKYNQPSGFVSIATE